LTLFHVSRLQHYRHFATTLRWILTASLLLCSFSASAGKLDDTRDAVRGGSDESGDDNSSSGSDSRDDGDWNNGRDDDADLIIACLIPIITPFCIIGLAADDNSKGRGLPEVTFFPYPYASGNRGHLTHRPPEYVTLEEPDAGAEAESEDEAVILLSDARLNHEVSLSQVTGRLAAEYHYDLDTIHAPGVSLVFDSALRLGFETKWHHFIEPQGDGLDQLTMGDLNIAVRFVETRRVEAHLAVGGRMMIDPKLKGGFNGGFRLTAFPTKPLAIAASTDLGNVGRTFFFEGQLTLGALIGRAELFAGYKGIIFQSSSDTVLFHGPVAGLSAWF
jgi:hypothetical protein